MCVKAREDIPAPSPLAEGQVLISVAPIVAAKIALYAAMREQDITNVALATRLGLQRTQSAGFSIRDIDPTLRQSKRLSKPSGVRWWWRIGPLPGTPKPLPPCPDSAPQLPGCIDRGGMRMLT